MTATAPPRIHYTVAFPDPATHLFEMTLDLDGLDATLLDLALPAWTPGSYKLRDYAKNVQDLRVTTVPGGRRLPIEKIDKNTWRVAAAGARRCRATYRVFAHELSVQTSHLDTTHAHINGASVFLHLPGLKGVPHTVTIRAPRGWRIHTGLDPVPGRAGTFRAPDYDVLIDSPFEIGPFPALTFRIRGVPHRLVIHGEGNFRPRRLLRDMAKIAAAEIRMMRHIPYKHYTFILHTGPERGGGLEHLNSTSLMVDRFTFHPEESYERYLSLVAHEFFHLWNVKRIRPLVLGPFDYAQENYTRLLWVMEGITSYYDTLTLVRAGLLTQKKYLGKLAETIARVQTTPGRRVQSLADSSFDTWIKFYQQNEHSINSIISYYDKGSLVGWLIDLEIRERTRGRRSLDDVFRLLNVRYARRGTGFPESAFQKTVEEVAGSSFAALFRRYVFSTAELDYARHVKPFGLKLSAVPPKPTAGARAPGAGTEARNGKAERPRPLGYIGIKTERSGDRLGVAQVIAGTPAWKAGLSARDELLAIDGVKLHADSFPKRIEERRPGSRLTLTVFRREKLARVEVVVGKKPPDSYKLEPVAKPDARQKRLLKQWIAGRP